MLFDRNLIICAALIALSTSLLFIYFNRKTKEIDDKMTSLFQLIQDYATGDDDDDSDSTGGYINVQEKKEMIQVSDEEDDYEVDDVDEDDDLELEELKEQEDNMDDSRDNLENNESNSQQINLFKTSDDTDSLEAVDLDIDDESGNDTKNIEVNDEVDLSKLKVTELKQLCSDKGLSGYSGLKKEELVNLLSS